MWDSLAANPRPNEDGPVGDLRVEYNTTEQVKLAVDASSAEVRVNGQIKCPDEIAAHSCVMV